MYSNGKVLILGFARSGYEAAKVLVKRNNEVIINDLKEIKDERYEELVKLGVRFVFGSHPDDLLNDSITLLVKNPGVFIDHKYVLKAKELNIPVINEVEMTYNLLREKCDVKIIGISGTNGKTTTTTLIYEMLKEDKKSVYLAGNIGYPVSSVLDKVKSGDIIVLETSAQQLENTINYTPDVAVLTNISEAHLDFFHTYEHYIYNKSKLILNQKENQVCILNKNDERIIKFSKDVTSVKKYFSINSYNTDCYLKDDSIYYNLEKIIDTKDILLRGNHNYENIMAAILAVKEFDVSTKSIFNVLTTFKGVKHRLQFVREVNGVKYYNDTEATNIKSTKIALSSFSEPIILLLGGTDRGQDFNELKDYIKNVKAIVGIGECRKRAQQFGEVNNISSYSFETLKEGFLKCVELSKKGDIVLLSPASASWGQYIQCEDRGDEFIEYVNNL